MEELRSAIITEIQMDEYNDNTIKERLSKIRPLEFIPYFLVNGDIDYHYMFFLSNLWYWEELDYDDWKKILIKISNSGLGIRSFFLFTYRFLKIDLIPFYINLKNVNEFKRYHSLMSFFERPSFLRHDNEAERIIDMYSFDKGPLTRMRNKLLSQGAIEAQRVEPRKELHLIRYKIIEPPSSWQKWAKELSLNEPDSPL